MILFTLFIFYSFFSWVIHFIHFFHGLFTSFIYYSFLYISFIVEITYIAVYLFNYIIFQSYFIRIFSTSLPLFTFYSNFRQCCVLARRLFARCRGIIRLFVFTPSGPLSLSDLEPFTGFQPNFVLTLLFIYVGLQVHHINVHFRTPCKWPDQESIL